MPNEYVRKTAEKLIRSCATRDPFRICAQTGVLVEYKDIGALKGFYTVIKRRRFIVISEKLTPREARVVCAHELGHDLFHRELARDTLLREFVLYQMNSRCEYEANAFAAELLIDEAELTEYLRMGYDISRVAAAMNTDVNLVALKLSGIGCRQISGSHYDPAFLRRS